MKKLKNLLTVLFIILLILSLWSRTGKQNGSYKSTEFLFDTTCTVTAYGKGAEEAAKKAFSQIGEIHRLTDFFSEDSEVSKINSAPENTPVKVDSRTFEILKVAFRIYEASGGAFDPTVAPVSELWDFKNEEAVPPSADKIKTALSYVGGDKIILDEKNLTVTKTEDGVSIDLGGAAKGYACNVAVSVFKELGINAVIDLGGNVSCTGKNPSSKDKKWRIGLQVPFKPTGEYSKVLTLDEGSVVTSGTYQRYFNHSEKLYHHILSPKTGMPKEADYSAVTIVCPSSLLADCLSTACFVLGREKGKALAEKFGCEIYFY